MPRPRPTFARAICCVALLIFCAALPLHSQQALDNDAILKLKTAGLSDDVIVSTVTNSPGRYAVSTDDLIALKKAGISDKVLGAMIQRNAGISAAAPVTVAAGAVSMPAGVDEVGVYYKDPQSSTWTEFSPEIINYKSGGALKSIASYGIVKPDKNGHIPGKTARIVLTRQNEILLYTPEGVSPEEYQLLKLRVNSDNREFRSETGGVIHKSSGADRDAVDFKTSKIGPRLYKFTLTTDEKKGEYGILPPGAINSANAASAGKMFTFALPE